jgi:hypothetical protein
MLTLELECNVFLSERHPLASMEQTLSRRMEPLNCHLIHPKECDKCYVASRRIRVSIDGDKRLSSLHSEVILLVGTRKPSHQLREQSPHPSASLTTLSTSQSP